MARGLKKDFTFYKAQLAEGVKVFGAFNAVTDENIFYRKSLIDFKFLALLFGRIADFYAGYGNPQVNAQLRSFLNTCAPISKGKQWGEVVVAKPLCQALFYASLDSYYTSSRKGKFPNKMIFTKVGSGIKAFTTTALVVGNGIERYQTLLAKYEKSKGTQVTDFTLDFETELKFGHWGRSEDLAIVQANLKVDYPGDAKSEKFYPLEGGTWFEVLATSPAEPGLSSLVRIPDSRKLKSKKVIHKKYFRKRWGFLPTLKAIPWFNEKKPNKGVIPFRAGMYSVGGWSDLSPVLVLKASGCKEVLYNTRQGGSSVFGQQIFIRLTGYTDKISFWKDLKKKNRSGWRYLTGAERNSPWNRIHNLANPNSSYNLSIREADVIYCTDWDKFEVFKKEIPQTLKDAYHAPLFFKDESTASEYSFGGDSAGKSVDGFPGCIPR